MGITVMHFYQKKINNSSVLDPININMIDKKLEESADFGSHVSTVAGDGLHRERN